MPTPREPSGPTGRGPKEEFIRRIADPDFGELELWRWRLVEWRGGASLPDGAKARTAILVDEGVEPEEALRLVTPAARTTFRHLVESEADIRRRIAQRELDMARDWAEWRGQAKPTGESFAASLRTSAYNICADGDGVIIDVWFEDTGEIFAGHGFYATYNGDGDLLGVSLFG
jgi:hypothetical protein